MFTFEVSNRVGGNLYGIFATDNPAQIAALEQAIQRRLGVSELTEGEYGLKKGTLSASLKSPPPRPRPVVARTPRLSMETKDGVALAAATPKPTGPVLPEPDKIAVIGRVNSPDPFAKP